MEDLKLGAVEARFADIIWDNEPLSSGSLVKLCERQLEWKKSTILRDDESGIQRGAERKVCGRNF